MTSLENSEPGEVVDDGHGHSHLGLALVVICVAQLMVVLDATIVNIAIPYIKEDLHFSNGNTPWIITGYTLAFGGLLLLGGRTGDLFGRRSSADSRRTKSFFSAPARCRALAPRSPARPRWP
jgi:MFS family permease